MKPPRWLRPAAAATASAVLLAGLAACSASSSASSASGVIVNVISAGSAIQRVFNPYLPVDAFGQGGTSEIQGLIYESLAEVSQIKADDDKPWLATSWQWSADGKALHFNLRHGVKWTDGKPFTSADVVFSYNAIKQNPALDLRGLSFGTVKADGPYGVNFTFTQQSTQTFDDLVQLEIVPKHIYADKGNLTKFTDPNPVGTGPFELASFSNQSFLLKKNPHYWQPGKPQIGGLRFSTVRDNNAVTEALVEGQADWASAFVANVKQTLLSKNPDLHIFWPVVGSDGLITNNASFPFNDLQVRKAVSLAISRKQIAAVAERGPATSAIGLPMPVFKDDIAPDLKNAVYQHSITKALALLHQDGYTKGSNGQLEKNGRPLAFTITIPQAFTEQVAAAQVVQAQLAPLGIKVAVQGVAVDAIDGLTGKGEFQATFGYPIATQTVAYNLYNAWSNPMYARPVGQAIPTKEDIQRTESPVLQSYFNNYLAATSDAARKQALYDIERFWVNNVPWIVCSYYQKYGDYSTAKVTGWPSASDPYWAADVNPVVALQLKPVK